MKIYIISI